MADVAPEFSEWHLEAVEQSLAALAAPQVLQAVTEPWNCWRCGRYDYKKMRICPHYRPPVLPRMRLSYWNGNKVLIVESWEEWENQYKIVHPENVPPRSFTSFGVTYQFDVGVSKEESDIAAEMAFHGCHLCLPCWRLTHSGDGEEIQYLGHFYTVSTPELHGDLPAPAGKDADGRMSEMLEHRYKPEGKRKAEPKQVHGRRKKAGS